MPKDSGHSCDEEDEVLKRVVAQDAKVAALVLADNADAASRAASIEEVRETMDHHQQLCALEGNNVEEGREAAGSTMDPSPAPSIVKASQLVRQSPVMAPESPELTAGRATRVRAACPVAALAAVSRSVVNTRKRKAAEHINLCVKDADGRIIIQEKFHDTLRIIELKFFLAEWTGFPAGLISLTAVPCGCEMEDSRSLAANSLLPDATLLMSKKDRADPGRRFRGHLAAVSHFMHVGTIQFDAPVTSTIPARWCDLVPFRFYIGERLSFRLREDTALGTVAHDIQRLATADAVSGEGGP